MNKIFDTHAHYDDEQYDVDRDYLLNLLYNNGINKIANISYDRKSILKSVELANMYDFLYAVIGYHPCDCAGINENNYSEIEALARNKKVVAIGEIGLDYYWKDVKKEEQQRCFIEQMDLAKRLNMPFVVHSRDAAQDTYNLVKSYGNGKGIIHCFSYSKEVARDFINLGYYIGIGGVLTFKNSKHIKEVVEYIPLEKIVLETDAPYLSPEPYRGKRNSSAYLTYVVDKIAEIKNVSRAEVCDITYNNAMRVYEI